MNLLYGSDRRAVFLAVLLGSILLNTCAMAQGTIAETLHDAAERGDLSEVKQLVAQGTDVNVRGRTGCTALLHAASKCSTSVAEFLDHKGADVNAKNRDGKTPLNRAEYKGHKRVAELLRAKEIAGCTMADLSIEANIPEGYTRIPTECPRVSFKRNLSVTHALGFYITETWYPYDSSDKKSLTETLDDYILLVQVSFDNKYKGQSYSTFRIDEGADYPPSLLSHGTCGGLVTRTPLFFQGQEGVEWRRGVMCLVELPPTGSEDWIMIQAFFFDMNSVRVDHKPTSDFKQVARRLFRSIRIKGLEEHNGDPRMQ